MALMCWLQWALKSKTTNLVTWAICLKLVCLTMTRKKDSMTLLQGNRSPRLPRCSYWKGWILARPLTRLSKEISVPSWTLLQEPPWDQTF